MTDKPVTRLKPMRAFRVEDDLWEQALARAQLENRTLSDVIRAGLRAYVAGRYNAVEPIRKKE